jgi:hypothetical protein
LDVPHHTLLTVYVRARGVRKKWRGKRERCWRTERERMTMNM